MPVRKYKPNNVYILEIDSKYYYGGCHTQKNEMYKSVILHDSGNHFRRGRDDKFISSQEYKTRCKIIHIEEFDTPEEAKNREVEIIAELKEKYGDFCLNQSLGNKYGSLGLTSPNKGKLFSDDHKRKISESMTGKNINNPSYSKAVLQFTKDGQFIAEYPSISEASRQTGIPASNISYCCSGKNRTTGGSIWKKKTTN